MKIASIFLCLTLAFSTANACGKCKPKHHIQKHIAGRSQDKPRSKDTTSKEIRKKPQKPQRSHEKKRDRYGVSCLEPSENLLVLNP